jgi:deoxyribose-phosphate aldolase
MKKIITDFKKFNESFHDADGTPIGVNGKHEPITGGVEAYEHNNMIDYTLLDESSTDQDIIDLCEKANMFGVKSVCVLPKHVSIAKERLADSKVLVCTVVSFPGGSDLTESKIVETNQVIGDGADEVDMVLNYEKLQSEGESSYDYLVNDVKSLVDICHSNTNKDGEPVILKVIVESGLLSEEETKTSTDICLEAGADFIKTSTGKVAVGAEMNKIKVMFDTIKEKGSDMKIKASGGVRSSIQINSMLDMVDRFGMGYGSVDTLNNLGTTDTSGY